MPSYHYERQRGNWLGVVCNNCGRITSSWPYNTVLGKAGAKRSDGWEVKIPLARRRHFQHIELAGTQPEVCQSGTRPAPVFPGEIPFEAVGDHYAMTEIIKEAEAAKALAAEAALLDSLPEEPPAEEPPPKVKKVKAGG